MKKINLKQNKGITMTDIVIAIIILCLFTGVVGNLYYQILSRSSMIRSNGVAIYYVVQVAERIDKIAYEEVTNELSASLKDELLIPDSFDITINVEKYSEMDTSKEDIIKLVTIKAEYEVLKEKKEFTIKKLKIKEI